MRTITITTIKNNKVTGRWNEKFYTSNEANTYRIYIDSEAYIINEEEKAKLLNEVYEDQQAKDEAKKAIIIKNFEELKKEAKDELIRDILANRFNTLIYNTPEDRCNQNDEVYTLIEDIIEYVINYAKSLTVNKDKIIEVAEEGRKINEENRKMFEANGTINNGIKQ